MTDEEEAAYEQGKQTVYRRLLGECIRNLGDNEPGSNQARLTVKLFDAERALHSVYEILEEDYPDGLYLADAIERVAKIVGCKE